MMRMSRLDLVEIATELLEIHKDIRYRFKHRESTISNFRMETFTQLWGNTSGGFETIGGCAMTSQRTYVFTPVSHSDENCIVYFGDRFAYTVPYSDAFSRDVKERTVAGCSSYEERYLSTNH